MHHPRSRVSLLAHLARPVRRARAAWLAWWLLVAVIGSTGCELTGFGGGGSAKLPPDAQASDVESAARRLYFRGMQDLVSGNYTQAVQAFQRVARMPSYVAHASLARLRIGDALFLQDRFEEAIQTYRAFVAQYESDPNMPYARFRIASAYHARMPEEWFLSVPAHEIDQTMTREAVRELTGFLRTFPASRYAPQARGMLEEAQRMLLDHELFVADFYASREAWRASAQRLQRAVRAYPELAISEPVIAKLATHQDKAGLASEAMSSYALYLQRFPGGASAVSFKARLAALEQQPVPAAPDASQGAPPGEG